jgi:hypothetical protein
MVDSKPISMALSSPKLINDCINPKEKLFISSSWLAKIRVVSPESIP